MKLIGISGFKGSGKDTLAKFIMAYAPYRKYSMADPIRAIGAIMGFTDEEMLDPVKKELVSEFFGIPWRKFAQWFGTDIMRSSSFKTMLPVELQQPEIWVRLAERHFNMHPTMNFVIADIRFDDEAQMVRNRNGVMVHVRGKTAGNDTHVSEKGITPNLIDVFINNTTSIEDLQITAEKMVKSGIFQ